MAEKPEQARKSAGRFLMSAGISLLMMADYIFHNRREIPALIVKAPKPTAPTTHVFALPEPAEHIAGRVAARACRQRSVRRSRRREKIEPS